MENFIEKLFYGNFDPHSDIYNDEQAKPLIKAVESAVNDLTAIITDTKTKQCIQNYIDSSSALTEHRCKKSYADGFRDGSIFTRDTFF